MKNETIKYLNTVGGTNLKNYYNMMDSISEGTACHLDMESAFERYISRIEGILIGLRATKYITKAEMDDWVKTFRLGYYSIYEGYKYNQWVIE